MLTHFKLWRQGTDLKRNDQSWTEAFNLHTFNVEEKKIMNNFNLHYDV